MGSYKSALNRVSKLQVAAVAQRTSDFQSADVDVSDFTGLVMVTLSYNAGGGTTPTMDAKLETRKAGGAYSDVPGGAFAQVTTVAGEQTLFIDMDGVDQKLRLNGDLGGTNPDYYVGCVLHGYKQHNG